MLGPLWLDPLIRATWGQYNPLVLAQLDSLVEENYQPKIYRVPDPQNEVIAAGGYVEFGLQMVPCRDVVYGFAIPPDPVTGVPFSFTFQLEDLSTGHLFFNEPIPSVLLSNYHPVVLDPTIQQMSCFWNLLNTVYPVVGTGGFRALIQSTDTVTRRIEVLIGALEEPECR